MRQYFEVHGDVQPAQRRNVFPDYHSHAVTLTDNFPVPLPCNGFTELRIDGQVVVRSIYSTATQKDPYNKDAGRAYAAPRLCSSEHIPLQPSIPPLKWIQLGNKGDRYIAQIKLQRVAGACNIHSDGEGNMYIYTLDKVYLHVKCDEHVWATIDDRGIGGGVHEACVKCNTRKH